MYGCDIILVSTIRCLIKMSRLDTVNINEGGPCIMQIAIVRQVILIDNDRIIPDFSISEKGFLIFNSKIKSEYSSKLKSVMALNFYGHWSGLKFIESLCLNC